jgi:hypothetical protein
MGWLSNTNWTKEKTSIKKVGILYGTNFTTCKNKSHVSNDTIANSLQFAPRLNPDLLFEK